MPRFVSVSDLRGAARLATRATIGATDVVEAMHEAVTQPSGIAGAVYRAARGTARRIGDAIEAALARIDRGDEADGHVREAVVAALNGAVGDHLEAEGNPLATAMQLRHGTGRFDLDFLDLEDIEATVADVEPALFLQVHGICTYEGQWGRGDHDPGAEWAEALDATRLAVRYNTGRHISQNGRDLATLLVALLKAWPVPVERLAIVGHSMGGLVARSALSYLPEGTGLPADTRVVTLGSPHHGAPLERLGNLVESALGAARYTGPLTAIGQTRSAGVTDLRYGNLRDEDWAGRDRFARAPDDRLPVGVPDGVRLYLGAATLGRGDAGLRDLTVGDGLVPLDSALGIYPDPARTLDVPPERRWTLPGASHLDLLWQLEVTEQVRAWLVDGD